MPRPGHPYVPVEGFIVSPIFGGTMFRLLPTLLLSLHSLPIRAADAVPHELTTFLDAHCTECHDDTVKKGGLNLLDLPFSPDDPANFATWRRVYERVRDGEMPPKKELAPLPEDMQPFLAGLRTPLVEVDEQRIAAGRVQSRRLTAREYENTIHDLLGIDIPLATLLPEDPETHGFETVASGQQLSYHQLSRYLETADLSLEEAFSRALGKDTGYRREFEPKELIKNGRGNYRGPDLRDGRSISWPITLQFSGRMRPTAVPESGWYRVTLKEVKGINPGKDGAVWGTLRSGECDSDAPTLSLLGLVEATGTPRDLVYEAWIEKGHQLELRPNDGTLKNAPSGAMGGNVSFKDRDLAAEGYSGISHRGIVMQRIYPKGDRAKVRQALFGGEGLSAWEGKAAEALEPLVERFARRAFRRPVNADQLAPHLALAREALGQGADLPEALRAAYRSVLCSPRFLTFVESPGRLDNHAIATRFAYALWCGPPDGKLIKLASEGRLRDPDTLTREIARLLDDPRADRFVHSYAGQWLKLKQIDFTTPDPKRFRTFDAVLQESFVQETRAYFAEMLRQDLGIDHLVASDFAFLNGRLARHYRLELPLEPGAGLQKAALPEGTRGVRGGLVTQGAILKVTADGSHTSPVIRGVFVNERILGVHLPPPPPGIPAIEPDIRGAVSIRDQLAKHRGSESCITCHLTIDPPGFALENFDPVGGWRSRYGEKGVEIDPSGEIPGGGSFEDIASWKSHYRNRDDDLSRGFVRQFLTYATGAVPHFSDEARIDAIVEKAAEKNHGLRSLITAALTSDIFLTK